MRIEVALLLALAACRAEAPPLTVLVTASMEQAITELAGQEAVVNTAASSSLARQIESGAPADLFVSADLEWAEWLAARVTVRERRVLASNGLVLIARLDDARSADELLSSRLALADPTHVPAGKYARASLQEMGRYRADSIAAAGDVRAALALVERGEADAGIVYRTDALASKKVRVVSELHSPIRIQYVAVLLSERARPLFDRLGSPEARQLLERHGFLPP